MQLPVTALIRHSAMIIRGGKVDIGGTQVCYVRKQGGLFTYNTIVYISITLFTLEGISRKGHMKSPTKCLETKVKSDDNLSKGLFHC